MTEDQFRKILQEELDSKLDEKLDKRFTEFEAKLDDKIDKKLDQRFTNFELKLDDKLDKRFAEFEEKSRKTLNIELTTMFGKLVNHIDGRCDALDSKWSQKLDQIYTTVDGLAKRVADKTKTKLQPSR